MILYKTVSGTADAEQIIEKSRFIAHVAPVSSKDEADAFIDAIRKQYKDATHNVPAMVIGDRFQTQWASDDGEPQGTSGAPMVQMMVAAGITDTVIVVTRYFGGIKLGTGGLVRAYTGVAKDGLRAAGVCGMQDMTEQSYRTDYSTYNRLKSWDFGFGVSFCNEEYSDAVTFDAIVDPDHAQALETAIANFSSGAAIKLAEGRKLTRVPLDEEEI
jgi:Uncharacterized conserved protein